MGSKGRNYFNTEMPLRGLVWGMRTEQRAGARDVPGSFSGKCSALVASKLLSPGTKAYAGLAANLQYFPAFEADENELMWPARVEADKVQLGSFSRAFWS